MLSDAATSLMMAFSKYCLPSSKTIVGPAPGRTQSSDVEPPCEGGLGCGLATACSFLWKLTWSSCFRAADVAATRSTSLHRCCAPSAPDLCRFRYAGQAQLNTKMLHSLRPRLIIGLCHIFSGSQDITAEVKKNKRTKANFMYRNTIQSTKETCQLFQRLSRSSRNAAKSALLGD